MAEKVRADVSDTSDETSIDTAEKGEAPRRRGMRVNFKVIVRSKSRDPLDHSYAASN